MIAILALFQRRTREPWWPLAVIVTIAFVYTTPWDNWLVANEVWTYPPGAVLFTIGYVPVEEYAFFVLQTVMTGLWLRILQSKMEPTGELGSSRTRTIGLAVFGAITAAGVACLVVGGHWLYMGLIVAWAGPILAMMWAIGGHLLWARRKVLALAILPPTVYLWAADWTAIRIGIWDITAATKTGVDLVPGLPIEEALFFLVTNMMVAQGLVMLERASIPETLGRIVPSARVAA